MNLSMADNIFAKSFNKNRRSHEPHDVMHAMPHRVICAYLFLAMQAPLMPLLSMQIRRVWACLTNEDKRGLVQGQDDRLVLVHCEQGNMVSHTGGEGLATVVVPC